MPIPQRTYTVSGGSNYRYGFNGKENDNEVKGIGNQQDYGMRIYDPRLGRFLSVDPIAEQYPELTPYQFASNTPIQAIDLDGKEAWVVVKSTFRNTTVVRLVFDEQLKNPGGVYYVHKYQSNDNVFFTESEASGTQNYSEYPQYFPNFAKGEFKDFSLGEVASSFRLRGDADILFGEVALKGRALGAEVGASFGVEGKLLGLNIDTDDRPSVNSEQNRGGYSIIGWNSTFRDSDQKLNVGGDASLLIGMGYRHKYDLNSGTFIKENEFKYNGVVTAASVNTYSGESNLSWGFGGKLAYGLGVGGEIKLSLSLNKLGESLRKLSLTFTTEEKMQINADQGGTKEFNPNNY